MFGFKKKNPCIKHKLWGKLKKKAKDAYRIFPTTKLSDKRWTVRYLDVTGVYEEYSRRYYIDYANLDDAIKELESLRESKFYSLCENVLYARECKKVADL